MVETTVSSSPFGRLFVDHMNIEPGVDPVFQSERNMTSGPASLNSSAAIPYFTWVRKTTGLPA